MKEKLTHGNNSIVPELRRLHSPDILDMQTELPEDTEHFCILVEAMIGPRGGIGEESFDFTVCTPGWLSHYLLKHDFLFGRHMLVVGRYDYKTIFDAISALCQGITGATWQEVAEQLSRYGKWEFEDYNKRHLAH